MGHLKSGELLDSTCDLATLYQCHRFTVMSACQDLVAEGWIETSQRSRYQVSAKIPVTESTALKKSTSHRNISKIANLVPDIDLERARYSIEFWGGQPDLRLFPKDEFRRVLSNALKRTQPDQLNYGLTDGLETCLKQVSSYLRRSRNLTNKELVMTNGSQEGRRRFKYGRFKKENAAA
ncbi:MAG: GntR family transcriptional regulator [Bdellovibrio sp.]|nr:GntR family transcriptional regulator [Bdellovibrio sp.]